MGTSQSSAGPGPAVPLVPPWADDVDHEDPADSDVPPTEVQAGDTKPVVLAPSGRFRDARRGVGKFARTGDNRDLRRALGHYVRTGYGGGGTMARRLGATASTAGRLNSVLQSGRGPDGNNLRDAVLASGGDVGVVLDAIAEAVSPTDGTQDSEASRSSVRNALTDLLERFPNTDLFALTDPQREFVIERYVALDVYGRFCLDLQQSIKDKASDPGTALRRLKQAREFISEQISAAFRAIRARGSSATTANIARLASHALREALSVFEEYAK